MAQTRTNPACRHELHRLRRCSPPRSGGARWALSAGLGVMAAIAVMTAVAAVGIGTGSALVGSDATTPMLGTLVLGFYASASLSAASFGPRSPAEPSLSL